MRQTSLFLFLILFLCACSETYENINVLSGSRNFEITQNNAKGIKKAVQLVNKTEKEIKNFEDKYNNALVGDSFDIPAVWEILLKKSFDYKALSKNSYDIRSYSLSSLYGFPEGPFVIPNEEIIAAVNVALKERPLTFVDSKLVKDDERIKISTEAYSTGFLIDKLAETLKSEGTDSALIRSGYTFYAIGKKDKSRWRVKIEHPDKNGVLSTVKLVNRAVSTSSELEGFFIQDDIKYTRIFNATTLTPVNHYRSVSVIAPDAVTAAALSTVFSLMPENEIAEICKRTGTSVMVLTAENTVLRFCDWQNFEN
jgi:thiamine biosynthesis lipoprotein